MTFSSPLFIPKMYCSVIGHQYRVQKMVTHYIKEYKCTCCGKEVSTNGYGYLVPLTDELKQIHIGLQQVINKRRSKLIVKKKVA